MKEVFSKSLCSCSRNAEMLKREHCDESTFSTSKFCKEKKSLGREKELV